MSKHDPDPKFAVRVHYHGADRLGRTSWFTFDTRADAEAFVKRMDFENLGNSGYCDSRAFQLRRLGVT